MDSCLYQQAISTPPERYERDFNEAKDEESRMWILENITTIMEELVKTCPRYEELQTLYHRLSNSIHEKQPRSPKETNTCVPFSCTNKAICKS